MKTITVPAPINGTPGSYIERTGSDTVFLCLSSNGPCQVQIGSQPAQSCIAGLVLGDPNSAPLNSVAFLNFGTADVDVTFDTGTTALKGATPSAPIENFFNLPIFGSAGSFGGTRAITPAMVGAAIPGTQVINGVAKTRQYIEITNFSANTLLYVFTDHKTGPNFDQCVGGVFGTGFRRFDLSQNLLVINPSATDTIQCTAYEKY